MKHISLKIIIIFISRSSSSTLPPMMYYPCSQEYSQENILYPSCIPAMCGVVTRHQFIPPALAQSLMAEILSLTSHLHQVFTAMDLHTHTIIREGVMHKMEDGEDVNLMQMLVPVVDKVGMLVKKQFNSSKMQLTFPLVVSMISPGYTPVQYTSPHVDLYSYRDTAPHVTAVLYLTGGISGGQLSIEGRGSVSPTQGGLVVFTAGEENTHWVGEVTNGTRVGVTMFWSCDQELGMEI